MPVRDEEKTARLFQEIREAGLDALVCRLSENVLTLSGYFPNIGQSFAVATKSREISVIAPEQEAPWFQEGYQDETRTFRGIWQVQHPPAEEGIAEAFRDLARDKKLNRARIGYEGSFEFVAPQMLAAECNVPGEPFRRMLRGVFPDAEFIDATLVLDRVRARKSARDVNRLRLACEVAAFCYEALVDAASAGKTDAEAAAAAEQAAYARGVGHKGIKVARAYAQVASGSLTGGWNMYLPSTQKRIEPGDMVLMELGLMVDGYWTDLTRSFVIGRANAEQAEVWETQQAALRAVLEAIRPGAVGAEVDRVGRTRLGKYAPYLHHHIGHGLGVKYHEPIPALNPRSTHVLEAGHYVAVEPGIFLPGRFGVRNEENAVVTDRGAEVLTSLVPTVLEVQ